MDDISYKKITNDIINELTATLEVINENDVNRLINEIFSAEKVFFVGVGRVLLSLKSIAKRLAHLGITSVIVGDITEPAITNKDLLIIGSGSGNTLFPVAIAQKAKEFNAKIVHIGSNPHSKLTELVDLFVRIPVKTKFSLADEIQSIQPMTSLFEQSLLLLGDIIALKIIRINGLNINDLWQYHANLE